MKFETCALSGLFVSCLLICVVAVNRMLFVAPSSPAAVPTVAMQVAAEARVSVACPLTHDGVQCLRRD